MKRLFLFLSLFLSLVVIPVRAFAVEDLFPACDSNTTASVVCQEKKKSQTPDDNSFFGKNGVLGKVAGLIAFGVGIASVIMIIIGGLKFVIASGDPSNIKSAKDTIIYALIGLIVATIAGSIIKFVLIKL